MGSLHAWFVYALRRICFEVFIPVVKFKEVKESQTLSHIAYKEPKIIGSH